MGSSVDPVAVFGALATVAAVTAALQASAVFALYPGAEQLEDRHDNADPGSQEMTDVKKDAKLYRARVVILNSPLAVINALVLAAWGDVVFVRMSTDWVFVAPWVGVLVAWLFLVAIPGWLHLRMRLN